MVQIRTTIEWAYEHYFVYLHLCIADSDCIITDQELSRIQSSVFPHIDKERASSIIKKVYLEFIAHNDVEKKDLIKNLAPKYLRTLSIRKKVLDNLKSILSPDEECEEQQMYKYIENAISCS